MSIMIGPMMRLETNLKMRVMINLYLHPDHCLMSSPNRAVSRQSLDILNTLWCHYVVGSSKGVANQQSLGSSEVAASGQCDASL